MSNPFSDFSPRRFQPQSSGVANRISAKEEVLQRLADGYSELLKVEVDRMAWIADFDHLMDIYSRLALQVKKFNYKALDIEAFCSLFEQSKDIPLTVPGPSGLYISALINGCPETRVALDLREFTFRFHFLGFRLPEGKTLIICGDTGDFTGCGLEGGFLKLDGSTGSWCGAGMIGGRIEIKGDTGEYTGQWMHGGQISVAGRMQGAGEERYGGEINNC